MIFDAGTTRRFRWASASRPRDDRGPSGDLHVVESLGGADRIAVIDGLGHGLEAAVAAGLAVRTLQANPTDSLTEALLACHHALGRTRGAVMSLARVGEDALSWVGVGNVDALLIHGPNRPAGRKHLAPRGGVIGHSMPPLRPSGTSIVRGDLLIMATDGLRGDFADHVELHGTPDRIVEVLIRTCRTGRDDALVFAARYDGAA